MSRDSFFSYSLTFFHNRFFFFCLGLFHNNNSTLLSASNNLQKQAYFSADNTQYEVTVPITSPGQGLAILDWLCRNRLSYNCCRNICSIYTQMIPIKGILPLTTFSVKTLPLTSATFSRRQIKHTICFIAGYENSTRCFEFIRCCFYISE